MAVARDLFVAKGYQATSVADVARAAGVVGNAVHWYFPTKDDLFAAVLASIFADHKSAAETDSASPRDRLIATLSANQQLSGLHRDAYQRMENSGAVRAVYTEAQGWLHQLLVQAIESELPEGAGIGAVPNFAQILVEGMCVTDRSAEGSVHEVVDLLLEALVALATARDGAADSRSRNANAAEPKSPDLVQHSAPQTRPGP
ncbi:TetR/AcrR family transcriptional regulator [Mycolicibacterium sp.]|uniref:TetR/AcrR family transcriptional regulator n=1 Tax=Mycolicibacterium sp. TaxID=2320850 RepID=UPI003D0C04AC